MTAPRSPERALLARRRALPWRRAFVAYAITLLVATHWPALTMPTGGIVTDKTAHLLAFGLLAALLWRTGWVGSRLVAVVIVLAWSLLDEVSQGIPGLARFVTAEDALANALGVLVAGAWLWALRPVGGAVNRMRLGLEGHAFDQAFRSGRLWLLLTATALACAAPVVVARFVATPVTPADMILVASLAYALVAALVVARARRAERIRASRERSCFACGASCRAARFDETGFGRCPACGAEIFHAQWSDPEAPSPRARARIAVRPAAVAAAAIALVFLVLLVTPTVFAALLETEAGSRNAPRIARFFGSQPQALKRAVDLAFLLALVALAVRLYRGGLADLFDRPVRCRRCGQDLRGTPVTAGRGRCGECGLEFIRWGPPAEKTAARGSAGAEGEA